MNMMTRALSRFPGFPQPNFAPDDEGAGGSGDGDDLDLGGFGEGDIIEDEEEEQDDGLDTGGEDLESDEGDDITLDAESILGDLFKTPKVEGDPTGGKKDPTPQEIQEQLATTLKAGLDGIDISDDTIPENFDPTDRKQLRALLTSTAKQSAANAIQLMFAPVQTALGEAVTALRREMKDSALNTVNASTAEQMLSRNVPAYNNKKLRPIVTSLFAQAKQRHPGNTRQQVVAVQKAVKALGLGTVRSGKTGGSSTRTGQNPLDLYAPNRNARQPTRNAGKSQQTQGLQALARMIAQAGKS